MAKEEKAKKRIGGRNYWRIRKLVDEIKEIGKEIDKWQEAEAEKLELYPDQINWGVGSIFDPMVEIVDGQVINAKVIGRLERDLFNAAAEKREALKAKDAELGELRDELAKKLGIWPDMINVNTGVIEGDYEEVDPDDQPEEKTEKAAEE